VEQNRDRLAKVAEQQKEAEHKRYLALVDELERSRAHLLELRQAELWARLFPAAEAALTPHNESVLVGATTKPTERTVQIRPAPRLEATAICELLREDARWLRDAAAPQERDLLAGRRPGERESAAQWGNPSAWELRREREARIRHADLSGNNPLA